MPGFLVRVTARALRRLVGRGMAGRPYPRFYPHSVPGLCGTLADNARQWMRKTAQNRRILALPETMENVGRRLFARTLPPPPHHFDRCFSQRISSFWQTAHLGLPVAVLDACFSEAASARRRRSAAAVYRSTSLKVKWPVTAPISLGVHPASASRRDAAFLSPCAAHSFGRPAALQHSLNQLPKPAAVKGLPYAVVRKVR